jgi:hypothetical protein
MGDNNLLDSRKLQFGLLVVLLVVALAIASVYLPSLGQLLVEVYGAMVGVYGIYCGANVANKWAVGRTMVGLNDQSPQDLNRIPDDPRDIRKPHRRPDDLPQP